jgi:flagellar assembly protein FliH
MSAVRKYSFDTEFAADGSIVSDAASRRFSQTDLETERSAAYLSGKGDAVAEAERQASAALKDLANSARAILAALDAERDAMRREGALLALAAARKIAGAALDHFGEARAAQAITEALDNMRGGARFLVRANPKLAAALAPRMETLGAELDGAIQLRADASLKGASIEIEWSDGVIRLDPDEIAARLDALVLQMLDRDNDEENAP